MLALTCVPELHAGHGTVQHNAKMVLCIGAGTDFAPKHSPPPLRIAQVMFFKTSVLVNSVVFK